MAQPRFLAFRSLRIWRPPLLDEWLNTFEDVDRLAFFPAWCLFAGCAHIPGARSRHLAPYPYARRGALTAADGIFPKLVGRRGHERQRIGRCTGIDPVGKGRKRLRK